MAQVQTHIKPCGICGGQGGSGASFPQVFRFPLPIIPPTAAHSSSAVGAIDQLVAEVPSGLTPSQEGGLLTKSCFPSAETIMSVCAREISAPSLQVLKQVTKCFNETNPRILRNFFQTARLEAWHLVERNGLEDNRLVSGDTWQENRY